MVVRELWRECSRRNLKLTNVLWTVKWGLGIGGGAGAFNASRLAFGFGVRGSEFGVQRFAFSVRRSEFGVQS